MSSRSPKLTPIKSIVEAFDVFDIDGDKFISREEIRLVILFSTISLTCQFRVTMSRLGQNLTSRELDEMVAVKGIFLFIYKRLNCSTSILKRQRC